MRQHFTVVLLFFAALSFAQNTQSVGSNYGTNQQNNNTSGINIGTNNGTVNITTNPAIVTPTNEAAENKVLRQFKRDSTKYKVLVYPFRQYSDCKKDYGQELVDQLRDLDEKDKLGISVGWLEATYSISPDFTTDSFEGLGKKLGADFILYGNYDKNCNSNSDSGEVCVKYISFLYHVKQTDNTETPISNIDVSKGSWISDVKSVLYSVAANKYAHRDWRKYVYYSGKATSFAKNPDQIPDYDLRLIWCEYYRDSDYYSYNDFRNDLSQFKQKHVNDTGMVFANYCRLIGDAYMRYAMYDSSLRYFRHDSYSVGKTLFCGIKLNLDLNVDATIHYLISRTTDDFSNLAWRNQLRYFTAILELRHQNYAKALAIMDSINSIVTSDPANYPDFYINDDYPPYLRAIHIAFAKIMLKEFSGAAEYLALADSLNNLHITNDKLPPNLQKLEFLSEGNKYDNPVCHYVSNDNYHLMFGGVFYRLCYVFYALTGNLSGAYSASNFYIDSLPRMLDLAVNKKAESWPHFKATDLIKISYEDYYNRAVLAYLTQRFDNSVADIKECLSMSPTFDLALSLLYKLNASGYGKNLLKEFHLKHKKPTQTDLSLCLNDWHW